MKIALEQCGKVYTVEDKSDDQTLFDMLGIFEGLLLQAGYRLNGFLDIITEEESMVLNEDNSKL